jgi:uncharacterized OB-fold protein
MTSDAVFALPEGLPIPVPEPDGLSAPFWDGLRSGELKLQRCSPCRTWQWGPEWICHHCRSFDMIWERAEPQGTIYTVERVWHPAHPALKGKGPYLIALIELPAAGRVRMIGNIVGDPMRQLVPGTAVRGLFEHHRDATPAFSLLQWEVAGT